MTIKNLVPIAIALPFFLFSCKKTKIKDQVETPRGFTEYNVDVKPNKKKSLFFFHLHHCPNCTLVQNHLIKSDEFQEATKKYNRYFLELGQPLGKELMEKYAIRGAPVFVLTDKDFNLISTSGYGLLSLTDFGIWLETGQIKAPSDETESLLKIIKKFNLKDISNISILYKFFDELRVSTEIKIDWNELINYSDKVLQEWSKTKFKATDVYANHYRLGLSYMNLAELAKVKAGESKQKELLIKALNEYEKINSGSVKADVGAYIFQIALYIQLKDDDRVDELVKLLEKENPTNKTLLYGGLAYSYLNKREDCKRVFEYTSKMKLEEIPTPADRIYQIYFRAQCHEKNKDLSSLKREYAELLESLDDSYEKSFPKKLEKIDSMIKKLEEEKTKEQVFLKHNDKKFEKIKSH